LVIRFRYFIIDLIFIYVNAKKSDALKKKLVIFTYPQKFIK